MGKGIDGKKLPAGITQRANGLYMGRVMVDGQSSTLYNRSLSQLKKEMVNLRSQMQNGTYIKPCDLTFEEWFKEWLETYKIPTVKAGTIMAYKKHYSAYIKKPIGNMKLQNIRPEHLQRLFNDMKAAGKKENTMQLTYCAMSGAFRQAVKNELIAKNPLALITRPKGESKMEKVVFTREQQALYLKYAEKSYLSGLLKLAIQTGMRNGELRGLLWSDIDFKNRVIHVRHTLCPQEGGGWRIDTPKTKTSLRDIPMTDAAYKILKSEEKAYKELQGDKVVKISNDDFVFSVFGKPVSKKRIDYQIEVMLKNMAADGVDFPRFTMHTTRHTFATRALEAGMPPKVLQTILGHATLSMTTDLYAHVMDDTKTKEMEKIAAVL
ncbi:MAG: site-specific integrase [Lachnospiraceae bacterium]|nr:site-specific integrase [Lachnospiraceae bacterium]